MACARRHTVRARAVWLAIGSAAHLPSWRMTPGGHLRADPVEAADGALGPEDLPLPPGRIDRDLAPVVPSPPAAIANQARWGPRCDDADIESRHACEMARDRAADGADAEARGENRSPRAFVYRHAAGSARRPAPSPPAAGRRVLRRRSTCCSSLRYERIVRGISSRASRPAASARPPRRTAPPPGDGSNGHCLQRIA
jgi:hypothetical protein